jgi:antitoxin component of MazEF toxin-antitoxin module
VKLTLRKVGNSLGIIIPKAALEAWGLTEGDALYLSDNGIHPPATSAGADEALDELRRKLAAVVVRRCTPAEIRARGLANLHRWKGGGVWVSAYDEWKRILEDGNDGALFAAMLGADERSARLRQSPPYAGFLSREELISLNHDARALLDAADAAAATARLRAEMQGASEVKTKPARPVRRRQ